MRMTVLDREEIEQSLALLAAAATTDANVKAAAEKLTRVLREADARQLLTTAEAAAALGIRSINTVKRWVATGYLHGVQRNGRVMIPVAEIARICEDDRVRELRAFGPLQEETADLGRDLSAEELRGLRATRPGRLPWQRFGGRMPSPSLSGGS